MQRMFWLESHIDGGTLEGGLGRVNQLEWNISVEEYQGLWVVYGGTERVFASDDRAAVDAFLYGMSLAYAVLPDDIFGRLKEQVNAL